MSETTPKAPAPKVQALDPKFKLQHQSTWQPKELQLVGDRDPWERQPGETDRNWGCFQLYRDMHPSVRSMAKAFAAYMVLLRPDDPTNPVAEIAYRAPAWFEHLGAAHKWRDRAREYDEWQDQDALQRLQSQRVSALVQAHRVGHELVSKAAEALQAMHAVAHDMILDETGQLVTIEKSALSPAAIVQLAKAGVELRRYALGMERGSEGSQTNVHVNIANVQGGQARDAGRFLPNPEQDEALLARVREIADGYKDQDDQVIDVKPLPLAARLAPGGDG